MAGWLVGHTVSSTHFPGAKIRSAVARVGQLDFTLLEMAESGVSFSILSANFRVLRMATVLLSNCKIKMTSLWNHGSLCHDSITGDKVTLVQQTHHICTVCMGGVFQSWCTQSDTVRRSFRHTSQSQSSDCEHRGPWTGTIQRLRPFVWVLHSGRRDRYYCRSFHWSHTLLHQSSPHTVHTYLWYYMSACNIQLGNDDVMGKIYNWCTTEWGNNFVYLTLFLVMFGPPFSAFSGCMERRVS